MFTVLVFSLLAVLLVVAGITAINRTRRREENMDAPQASGGHPGSGGHHPSDAGRRARKAQRAQSRHDRRKRR